MSRGAMERSGFGRGAVSLISERHLQQHRVVRAKAGVLCTGILGWGKEQTAQSDVRQAGSKVW
ncbi:hypothetical protein LZ32DRAFT_155734 [Colletotrichum eremochloae]|nr:hypothetical protein LZ32DRAFT_155734 [Colletotrichum eremochloae]